MHNLPTTNETHIIKGIFNTPSTKPPLSEDWRDVVDATVKFIDKGIEKVILSPDQTVADAAKKIKNVTTRTAQAIGKVPEKIGQAARFAVQNPGQAALKVGKAAAKIGIPLAVDYATQTYSDEALRNMGMVGGAGRKETPVSHGLEYAPGNINQPGALDYARTAISSGLGGAAGAGTVAAMGGGRVGAAFYGLLPATMVGWNLGRAMAKAGGVDEEDYDFIDLGKEALGYGQTGREAAQETAGKQIEQRQRAAVADPEYQRRRALERQAIQAAKQERKQETKMSDLPDLPQTQNPMSLQEQYYNHLSRRLDEELGINRAAYAKRGKGPKAVKAAKASLASGVWSGDSNTVEDLPRERMSRKGGVDPDWFTKKAVIKFMADALAAGQKPTHQEVMRMANAALEAHRKDPSQFTEFLPQPGEKKPQFNLNPQKDLAEKIAKTKNSSK